VPTENASALGPLSPAEATQWIAMGRLLVPFGGLLAGELQPGEILVVNGATGPFGSAGVMVGLALGARAVLATGRNERPLGELARRLGPRVMPVAMRGDEAADRARIVAAAPGPIDCVLDLLPPMASPAQVRTALLAVRPNGRVVLMGGVGMQVANRSRCPTRGSCATTSRRAASGCIRRRRSRGSSACCEPD